MAGLLAALPGIVPDGPLHPALATAGVVAGVAVAVVAGQHTVRWLFAVLSGSALLYTGSQGDGLWSAVFDRPDRLWVAAAIAVVPVLGAAVRPRRSTATAAALCACGGVWAVVPDTEAPLLAAAVLGGAAAMAALPGWLPDARRSLHSLLLLLPLWAAAAGSIGRPARFGPGLLAAMVTGALGVAGWCSFEAVLRGVVVRRQRAGTPTTVAPGATSSTTTAPAPTTAP